MKSYLNTDHEKSEQLISRINFHLKTPGETLDEYKRRKTIALGTRIQETRKVYLDKNFWIYLRDVYLGRSRGPEHQEFYDVLIEKTKSGDVLFPVSDSLFIELLKQSDDTTRLATARVIDELSGGISFLSMPERIQAEIYHFVEKGRKGVDKIYPLAQMVWGTTGQIGGSFSPPEIEGVPSNQVLALQKASIDVLWSYTIEEVLKILSNIEDSPDLTFAKLARNITEEKFRHESDLKSFKQTFLIELEGILITLENQFSDLFRHIFEKEAGRKLTLEEERNDNSGKLFAKLIHVAFEKGKISTELPFINIYTGIHAAVRWDKKRKFKEHDFLDFHHAATALPYCDVFCTDNPLRVLLTGNLLSYDSLYSTKIISDVESATKCILALHRKGWRN